MLNAHLRLGGLALALAGAGAATPAWALYARPILEHVHEDDRDALLELASQPAAVREAALEVALDPGGIARLQGVRAWAERSFRGLLEAHSPELRVVLWTLAPHTELVHELALRDPNAGSSPEQLAESYPEAVVLAAVACEDRCLATLIRIDALNAEAGAAFEAELDAIPESARDEFRTVLAAPGVLNLLTDQMRLTVALAEAQLRDPQRTRAALSELHAQLADAQAVPAEGAALEVYEIEPARAATVVRVPYGAHRAGRPYYAYDYGYPYSGYAYGYGSLLPYAAYGTYGSPYWLSFAYGSGLGFGHHHGSGHGGHHVVRGHPRGHGHSGHHVVREHHGGRGKHIGRGHRRRGGLGRHVGRGHGRGGRPRPALSSSPRRGHQKHRASGGSAPSLKVKGKARTLRRLKQGHGVRVADVGRSRGSSRQHRRRR